MSEDGSKGSKAIYDLLMIITMTKSKDNRVKTRLDSEERDDELMTKMITRIGVKTIMRRQKPGQD